MSLCYSLMDHVKCISNLHPFVTLFFWFWFLRVSGRGSLKIPQSSKSSTSSSGGASGFTVASEIAPVLTVQSSRLTDADKIRDLCCMDLSEFTGAHVDRWVTYVQECLGNAAMRKHLSEPLLCQMLVFATRALLSQPEPPSMQSAAFCRFLNLALDIAVRGRFEDRPLLTSTACECLREIELCAPGLVAQNVEPLASELEKQQCIILQSFVRLVQVALAASGADRSPSNGSQQALTSFLAAVANNISAFTAFVIAELVESLRPLWKYATPPRVLEAFKQRYSKFVYTYAPVLLHSCVSSLEKAPTEVPSVSATAPSAGHPVFKTIAALSSSRQVPELQVLVHLVELVDQEIGRGQLLFSQAFDLSWADSPILLHAKLALCVRRLRHFGSDATEDVMRTLYTLSKEMPSSASHHWSRSFFWFVVQVLAASPDVAPMVLPIIGQVMSMRPHFIPGLVSLFADLASALGPEQDDVYHELTSQILETVADCSIASTSHLAGVVEFLVQMFQHLDLPEFVLVVGIDLLLSLLVVLDDSSHLAASLGQSILGLVRVVVSHPALAKPYKFDASLCRLLEAVERLWGRHPSDTSATARAYRSIIITVHPSLRARVLSSVSREIPSSPVSPTRALPRLIGILEPPSSSIHVKIQKQYSNLVSRLSEAPNSSDMLLVPFVVSVSCPAGTIGDSSTFYGTRLRFRVASNLVSAQDSARLCVSLGNLAPDQPLSASFPLSLSTCVSSVALHPVFDFFDETGQPRSVLVEPLTLTFDDLCMRALFFRDEHLFSKCEWYNIAMSSQVHQWTRFLPYVSLSEWCSSFASLLGISITDQSPDFGIFFLLFPASSSASVVLSVLEHGLSIFCAVSSPALVSPMDQFIGRVDFSSRT